MMEVISYNDALYELTFCFFDFHRFLIYSETLYTCFLNNKKITANKHPKRLLFLDDSNTSRERHQYLCMVEIWTRQYFVN